LNHRIKAADQFTHLVLSFYGKQLAIVTAGNTFRRLGDFLDGSDRSAGDNSD
jgi:hypothetical protein